MVDIMTTTKFVRSIQEYYGIKYERGTLKYLLGYLEKQPFRLELIFEETLKVFSGQYKTLPDIAIFTKIEEAQKMWNKEYAVLLSSSSEEERNRVLGYKPKNKSITDGE